MVLLDRGGFIMEKTLSEKKTLKEIAKKDMILAEFLKTNFNNFTLASYVDYLAKMDGERPALCHVDKNGDRREFSYGDLSELSNKMANFLRKKGIKKGDVVALVLRNNYEFYIVSLALQKLGAITLTLQFMNKEKQYKSIFSKCNPKCVIADDYEIVHAEDSSFVLDEINKACGNDEIIKLCTYPKNGFAEKKKGNNADTPNDWEELYDYLHESSEFESEQVRTYDIGYLFATSGTTGEPKIVMHNYAFALSHFFTGLWYGVEEGKKHYTIADSGWGMGTWNMCAVLLHRGIAYVNDYDRFNPEMLIKCMDKEEINSLCAPPSILNLLLMCLERNSDLSKLNLKVISSAGEPVDSRLKKRCIEQFGIVPREGYGMTELSLAFTIDEEGKQRFSPLYDHIVLERINSQEKQIVVTSSGNIGICTGYLKKLLKEGGETLALCWKPPEENRKTVWRTGDVGNFDDGKVLCRGRAGSTVKINDQLVNMREVEKIIEEFKGVSACLVECVEDDENRNCLVATIELEAGYEPTESIVAEIQAFVKNNAPEYYRPKMVDIRRIPRTTSGKVKRKTLGHPVQRLQEARFKLSA